MFTERYKAAFELLERPLKAKDGMDEILLEPLRLPLALHEYYLVAGNEQHFNHSHNRLLAPKDTFNDGDRFVFMEENQSVVYWGVAKDSGDDPPVEQGVNTGDERLEWHPEHASCAEFLEVMLFSQASFGGGMKYSASAVVEPEIRERLEQTYRSIGRIGEMQAFARKGCALTLFKWSDNEWRIFGGFSKKKLQTAVGKELGLYWEEL